MELRGQRDCRVVDLQPATVVSSSNGFLSALLRQDGSGSGWRVSTLLIWPWRSCGRLCARRS
jgi:hypothetical protein